MEPSPRDGDVDESLRLDLIAREHACLDAFAVTPRPDRIADDKRLDRAFAAGRVDQAALLHAPAPAARKGESGGEPEHECDQDGTEWQMHDWVSEVGSDLLSR